MSEPDAALPADAIEATDTMPDAPDAPSLPAWGTPAPITELAIAGVTNEEATLTADQLVMVFVSNRAGGLGLSDLWTTKRPSTTAAWGAPTAVMELSSTAIETHPWISADGLRIYFASSRSGGAGSYDIYTSVRATRASAWSAPSRVTELDTTAPEYGVFLAPDGLHGVMDAMRGGVRSLHAVSRSSANGAFTSVAGITEINGPTFAPYLADAGRVLYYTDGTDLWVAVRPDTASAFAAPQKELAVVGSTVNDPWVSEDRRTMVVTLDGGGARDLYVTTR